MVSPGRDNARHAMKNATAAETADARAAAVSISKARGIRSAHPSKS
jgi:hypothetical protein